MFTKSDRLLITPTVDFSRSYNPQRVLARDSFSVSFT